MLNFECDRCKEYFAGLPWYCQGCASTYCWKCARNECCDTVVLLRNEEQMKIKPKRKREVVLYAKVSKSNKAWVERQANKLNMGVAEFVDQLIETAKKK